jgi:hypothetical protein
VTLSTCLIDAVSASSLKVESFGPERPDGDRDQRGRLGEVGRIATSPCHTRKRQPAVRRNSRERAGAAWGLIDTRAACGIVDVP